MVKFNLMSVIVGTLVLTSAAIDGKNFSLTLRLPISDNTSSPQLQQFCQRLKPSDRHFSGLKCSEDGPSLAFGNCVTYDKEAGIMSFSNCPNIQSNNYTLTRTRRNIQLPENFSQLNDYMCGPLNRNGIACSKCANGFGPSFTSLGYNCVSCRETWYRVPLFLCLELVPITIFYFIILVFQISFATAPMPCFIMYAQFIVASFYLSRFSDNVSLKDVLFTHDGSLRLDIKLINMVYGVFNLDFLRVVLPPLCINRQTKFIHIISFGYVSALHPIFLISLTWISIELHGRNFRLLVWLWRPFHKCFVSLRRSWNTKSDIIDVFITFFLLSYSKCMYLTLFLLTSQGVYNYTESGKLMNIHHRLTFDPTVTYGSKEHLVLLVPAMMIFFILNIVPPLLLTLHPHKVFKWCQSKCRINLFAVNIFVEKLQGCYRDGLDGGRDMRSFSSLYFFLRMAVYLTAFVSRKILTTHRSLAGSWVAAGTVLFIMALIIALIKPYKAAYMNYLDTILLSNLALMLYLLAARVPYMLQVSRILLLSPVAGLLLIIFYNKFSIKTAHLRLMKALKAKQFSNDQITDEEKQPLLQTVTNNFYS